MCMPLSLSGHGIITNLSDTGRTKVSVLCRNFCSYQRKGMGFFSVKL